MVYKNLPVSPETHEAVQKLAELRGRTLGKQVEFWLSLDQATLERMGIERIESLPRPDGAEPIPLVFLTKHKSIALKEEEQFGEK